MADPLQRPPMIVGPLPRPMPGDPAAGRGANYAAIPYLADQTDPPYPTTIGPGVYTQPGIPQVPFGGDLTMPGSGK